MNSTQRAPSAVRQTPRTHLCTYDGSSTVRVTQGCHVGLLAVMACAPCFDPLLCKHHQLHRRWSDHPILAHRQVQNSPRIYGKTKVIPKAGTRFSTLGRRPKAIHTLTVVGITSDRRELGYAVICVLDYTPWPPAGSHERGATQRRTVVGSMRPVCGGARAARPRGRSAAARAGLARMHRAQFAGGVRRDAQSPAAGSQTPSLVEQASWHFIPLNRRTYPLYYMVCLCLT